MSDYLGLDTSNYTTSSAIYSNDVVVQSKKLLPVKEGEKGLRQSDAVFHHTVQMPEVINKLFDNQKFDIKAVGCSSKPCDTPNSYMPCFLVGKNTAFTVSKALGVPYYEFSHQSGHIAAAIYSTGRSDLLEKEFIAFHLSGGTTQAILVKPDKETVFKTQLVAESLDLKAGQAIDRVGLMLGLKFPCGAELEKLALQSDSKFNIKVQLKGNDCCLSGLENQCKKMLDNYKKEDVALYCIEYIKKVLSEMTGNLQNVYGNIDFLYAGGVMSNSIIRNYISDKFNGYFAKPEFSCDNAAGIAYLTYLRENSK
ncbi:MAG: peptidase M22 [Clostridia bacterium]|nr:peptidase M22 [Clostridia bacterium]